MDWEGLLGTLGNDNIGRAAVENCDEIGGGFHRPGTEVAAQSLGAALSWVRF